MTQSAQYTLDGLKTEWKNIGKAISNRKKGNKEDPCQHELQLKKANELKQKEIKQGEEPLLKEIDKLINTVGNLVHDSVRVSNNEDDNGANWTLSNSKQNF
jgi:seryl-tRNA synthetase